MKLRKLIITISAFLFAILVFLIFSYLFPSDSRFLSGIKYGTSLEDFTKIAPLDSADNVTKLLGEPLYIRELSRKKQTWYYSDKVEGVWRFPSIKISFSDSLVSSILVSEENPFGTISALYEHSEDGVSQSPKFEKLLKKQPKAAEGVKRKR